MVWVFADFCTLFVIYESSCHSIQYGTSSIVFRNRSHVLNNARHQMESTCHKAYSVVVPDCVVAFADTRPLIRSMIMAAMRIIICQ